MAITIYPADCTDFSTNGLGLLTPITCTVTEEACGMFELEVEQPIDSTNRWALLVNGAIIKAPVPTRESPLNVVPDPEKPAQPPAPQTVVRNVWEVTGTTVGEYMRSGPGMQYKKYGYLKNGARVNEIGNQMVGSRKWLHVIVQKGGRDCWMSTRWLKQVGTTEEVMEGGEVKPAEPSSPPTVTPVQARDQLFRIYNVERDTKKQIVTAKAMHIFYDLRANLVKLEPEKAALDKDEKKKQDISDVKRVASAVLASIWSNLAFTDHGFSLHVDAGVNGQIQGDYSWKNPIECMLDPDQGILSQAKAILVRDNYDIYAIPDTVHDSQVTIRRYKNLKGVTVTEDNSEIVTRIIPCGKDADGNDLFLDGDPNYVDSPFIAAYPFPYVKKIDYDVKVLKDPKKGDEAPDNETTFADNASARAKLLELAQNDYEENGVDLPTYTMKVDFVLLQNTEDYADYADLQAVFLNDTVTIIDSLIGLTAKVRVSGYSWDAIRCQYDSVTLGDLDSMEQTVYSYNLPTGGVSGSKIAPGSLGGNALRDFSIDYAKISVAAIEQLTADTITAVTARIEELIAGSITAESITTALLEAVNGVIEHLKANDIETDELTSKLAEIGTLIAGTAMFDRATIEHLVASAMNLEFGVGEEVYIKNLMISYAQIVSATINDLIVKASDGNYYQLDVNEEGQVVATKVEPTEGEISDGHTESGRTILDTDIVADNLSTSNLFATYALLNKIDAARIDVDTLFAREAFITLLRTSEIFGGESLEFWVGDSIRKVETEYYISDSPSVLTGGEWSTTFPTDVPSDKYIWRHIKTTKVTSEPEITGEECITSQTGAQGPAGVGIESLEEFYALSSDATPPEEWNTEPQTPTPEQPYHWNKEKFTYTDQSTQETKPHIIGVYGQDGKVGRGVKSVINYFLISAEASGITRDSEGWTTDLQTPTVEKPYLWTYEETEWTDGSENSYTNPIIIGVRGADGQPGLQGLQGEKGDQGLEGPPGPAGTSSYFHIRYSMVEAPQSSEEMNEEGGTYIGTYVDSEPTDSNDPFQYTWRRFQGAQGPDGKQGLKGDNGTNGQSSYLHIKYSNDGGVTLTDNDGETPGDYIGFYVDFTVDDSTDVSKYKWSKTKGEQGADGADGSPGKGISTITNYYLAYTSNTGVSTSTAGWTTTPQTMTSSKRYLWNYEVTTYTDESRHSTAPRVIGVYGNTGSAGSDGKGIKSIDEYYALSTSTTAPADTSFSTTVPTMTSTNRFLWNYEKISYTDNTSTNSTKHIIGVYGQTGAAGSAGKGINTITNYYLASNISSGVTTSTSGWTTSVQSITSSKRYLWNYEVTTYTDKTTYSTTPHLIGVYGSTGSKGTDGKGIKSIDEYYALSTSTTAPADTSFTTTIPTMTSTNRYLWNYEKISYTDNTSTNSTKHIIGVYGQTGASGKAGAHCTPHEQYYLSTSATTQTGGSWAETQPEWEEGKYLWERLRLVWSDGSADTYTTPSRATALEQAIKDANDAAGLAGDALNAANSASEAAANAADSANSAEKNANDALSKAKQMEAAVNDMNITLRHMKFDPDEGLIVTAKDINNNDSIWYSVVRETGFAVCNSTLVNQEVFYAYRDRCRVQNLEIGMETQIVAKATTTGGVVWGPAD